MIEIKACPTYKSEISYVLDIIFGDRIKIAYEIIWQTGLDHYEISTKDKVLYLPNTWLKEGVDILDHTTYPKEILWIYKSRLPKVPKSLVGIPVLFGDREGDKSLQSIDVFSTVFFFLSRIEEWGATTLDKLGRYDVKNSVAYKLSILDCPIVDQLVAELAYCLGLEGPSGKYEVDLSFDIDHPFIGNYSLSRNLKEAAKDILLRKDPSLFIKRLFFLASGMRDRFDPHQNFKWLVEQCKAVGQQATFFLIARNGGGGIDGAYDVDSDQLRPLLKYLISEGMTFGYHSSIYSFGNRELVRSEVKRVRSTLSDLGVDSEIGVRAHYLTVTLPESLDTFAEMGLKYDTSLLFPNSIGFRCGTCHRFAPYSPTHKRALDILERPLLFMDTNLERQTDFTYEEFEQLTRKVKYLNGQMTMLFHNNLVISKSEKKRYRKLLKIATSL